MASGLLDQHGRRVAAPPPEPVAIGGFEQTREPEPEWRAQLAAISPRSEQVPYLWLAWLPGMPYEPVQRWAVFHVMPEPALETIIRTQQLRFGEPDVPLRAILQDLRGVSPRDPSNGRWVFDPKVPGRKRWRSNSLVDLQQWELYRELRGFATLFWIVQGEHGGHKRSFSPVEVEQLRRMGLPVRPAQAGSLPYAPFDRRVIDQLVRFDRLQQKAGDFTKRYGNQQAAEEAMEADRAQELATIEAESDAWLLEQVAGVVDHLSRQRLENIVAYLPVQDEPARPLSIRGGL